MRTMRTEGFGCWEQSWCGARLATEREPPPGGWVQPTRRVQSGEANFPCGQLSSAEQASFFSPGGGVLPGGRGPNNRGKKISQIKKAKKNNFRPGSGPKGGGGTGWTHPPPPGGSTTLVQKLVSLVQKVKPISRGGKMTIKHEAKLASKGGANSVKGRSVRGLGPLGEHMNSVGGRIMSGFFHIRKMRKEFHGRKE